MFRRIGVVFILLVLGSVAVGQNDSRAFSGYHWYDDGISFIYPLSIADDAITQLTTSGLGSSENIQIIFQNYQMAVGWMPTGAEINITPTSTLPADQAQRLLSLSLWNNSNDGDIQTVLSNEDVPTTITVTHTKPIDFGTGTGTRIVTSAEDGMGARSLSYRYFGKTADNNYLINALFPIVSVQFTQASTPFDTLIDSDFTPNLQTLDVLIQSLHVTSPTAMYASDGMNIRVDFNDIYFGIDAGLAYRVEADEVEPINGVDADNTMFGVTPGYTRFSFAGYPITGSIQSPHVFVYPVSEFPDQEQRYGDQLARLQTLLAQHPDPSTLSLSYNQQNPLPVFPLINAAQVIVANPQYVRFINGEGIRYITYYAQDFSPITADDLFYVFVGLSDDGQHIVSAIFPLYAGFLPQGDTINNIADWDRFAMNHQTYLDGVKLLIDVIDVAAYMPEIGRLDALVATIEVK